MKLNIKDIPKKHSAVALSPTCSSYEINVQDVKGRNPSRNEAESLKGKKMLFYRLSLRLAASFSK